MAILVIGLFGRSSFGLEVSGFETEDLCHEAMAHIGDAYGEAQRRERQISTTTIITVCLKTSQ